MNTNVTAIQSAHARPIAERVIAIIARETHRNPRELKHEDTLEALGIDSVDVVMILNGIEEEFGVYLPVEQGFSEVKCLLDFVTLVSRQIDQQMHAAQPNGIA